MGWERGRYYTRSMKVNGRVIRQYIGIGPLADMWAKIDGMARQQRSARVQAKRDAKAKLAALDIDIETLCKATDVVARAALLAAGFHQHKRGEWRKRREPTDP